MKELRDEQNGVKWSSERVGSVNVIHHMELAERTLSGGWVGPRWVFRALVEMSPSERLELAQLNYDECIGRIATKINQFR
jgi:hypothetical protein